MEGNGGGKRKIKLLEDLYGLNSYGRVVLDLADPRIILYYYRHAVNVIPNPGWALQFKHQPMICPSYSE